MGNSKDFVDVFGKLSNVFKLQMIQDARSNGAWTSAEEHHEKAGMSTNGLYKRLKKEVDRENKKKPVGERRGMSQYNKGKQDAAKQRKDEEKGKLTRDEKKFLKGLKEGTATLEEGSRFVAVKVFEKMFENPGNVKFLDFFRTELLKIKKMEAETKKTWAIQILQRMFGGGELPPPVCPKCKHVLVKGGDHLLAGNIIGDVESISDTINS